MRILQVVHKFLPRHRAGAEIYTSNLCRELSKRHKVHLLYTEGIPELSQYSVAVGKFGSVACTRVTNNLRHRRFSELYDNPRMDTVFRSVLDSFEPNVVHFQHLMHHSVNYAGIASGRGIPSLMTLHDFWPVCERWGKRYRTYFPDEKRAASEWDRAPFGNTRLCDKIEPGLCARCFNRAPTVGSWLAPNLSKAAPLVRAIEVLLEAGRSVLGMDFSGLVQSIQDKTTGLETGNAHRWPLEAADIVRRNEYIKSALSSVYRFISPSRFLADEMGRLGYQRKRILFLDNGFVTSAFEGFKRKIAGKVRFGYIGTVAELKGVHVLVKAFRSLGEAGASLEIFGGTGEFPHYVKWLKELAGDAPVTFHGRFAPGKVADTFSRIDVLVTPSIWYENSPLVIHEAFLTGTPVLTAGIGGMPDLVEDGVNGMHFEQGDSRDLARMMKTLIDNPDNIRRMGEAAPGVSTIEENARAIERLYEEAIEARRKL